MRCAPIAVAYRDDFGSLFEASVDSSWITHADPRCTYGCALLNRVIAGLLDGNEDLDEAIEDCRERADGEPGTDELFDAVEDVSDLKQDEVSGTGYVVDTLQESLYYALTADSFEEAVVNAVNGGGDTDTVGAVTGAVAGARFGETDIPNRWLSVTESVDTVESVAEDIHQI
jgi:ADP-ribosyl-[dinitrogen reductase] hydrolase